MIKTLFLFILLLSINPLFGQNIVEILSKEKYETEFIDDKQDSVRKLLIGTEAKDFKFKTMEGDSVQLSRLEGKATIINIFFCACAPCMKEIPLINKLAKEYTNKGVNFISISITDSPKAIKALEHFLSNKNQDSAYIDDIVVVPAYYSENEENTLNETKSFLYEEYKVFSAPTIFFIDRDNIIRYVSYGYDDKYSYYNFYSDEIEALLKE
ncbi:Peroxiredoxin [Bernardetia litoralis DSM 6794]|uniref:Peroxiredoxin n=1 Tax=Bernardetia litoralis (strain ATCC 23117 / DSM 6794 / NBRC 15988 / NCIMB 1366 / Fx l1 / Sio-4) TaxID=880071 RepID=I4AM82_BERLS|nr:TlpA disulfide reductase family protein [Bernardetia litoralis]AFM05067.1 Peroxiredoxin [Bernardetia litoralis DSM 6794]